MEGGGGVIWKRVREAGIGRGDQEEGGGGGGGAKGTGSGEQDEGMVCLLVGCLTSQQHATVSQGRICSDNFTCCHTEIEVADQTFYLTQS